MDTAKKDNTVVILDTLLEKSVAKQETYLSTLESFFTFKKVMKYLIDNYRKQLKNIPQKISLEFSDMGIFEAKMQVAGDLILFNMHSNVFAFDENHWIWGNEYVKSNQLNSYCGIINFYNFMADSFKYQRLNDYGYIVARIFINREGYYFVEGNPDFGSFNEDFGKKKIDMEAIREIIQSIIRYSLEVDLIVPTLENIQIATVGQIIDKLNDTKISTGKPLGFQSGSSAKTEA